MGNARNIADGETRFVNATGDTISGALTIDTATSGVPTINLQHSNGGADNFKIMAGTTGVSNGGFSIRDIDASANRFIIDGSGHVTMPNQPAFHVGVNANQTLSSNSTVVFQQQFTNIGSHYNTSNGIFTAPVAGFYSFTYRLLHENVSNGHAVDSFLSRNNSGGGGFCFQSQRHKYQADYTGHAGYIYESTSGMIYLGANDTMRVKYGGAQNSTIHNNQNWSYFCGHLVG